MSLCHPPPGVVARSEHDSEFKTSDFEGRTIRDANCKLIQRLTGERVMYALQTDFTEAAYRLASSTNHGAIVSALRTQGERIRA